ncbi:MAG TPA: sensor histidine kinase [Chloroflexota bacterium]|nr:sensor histidine kinase [Chloroflexota bacterium]
MNPTAPRGAEPAAAAQRSVVPARTNRFPARAWLWRWTLRRQLLLAISLCLLPLALLLAWSVRERAAERRAAEIRANRDMAAAVAAAFEAHARDIDHQLMAIAFALGWRFDLSNHPVVQAYLTLNRAPYRSVVLLAFVDPSGEVVAADPPDAVGSRLGDEWYVRAAMQTRETVFSDVLPAGDGVVWWAAARGVYRSSGDLAGVLVSYTDPQTLEETLQLDRVGGADIAIVDRQGRLAYHSHHPQAPWAQRDFSALPHVRAALQGAGNGVVSEQFRDPFDGRERLGAAAPVPSLGWVALADRPLAEVMAPIEEAARREAGLFAVVVLLDLVGAALLAVTLTRPLRSLAAAMRAVEGGNLDSRLPARGSDEVAELARRFNAMAEHLHTLELERQAFSAMVAHDLRSPLTAIRGTAQLLLRQLRRGSGERAALEQGLETIIRESDRVANLASELSDASQAAAGRLALHPELVDLVALTREAVERLRASGVPQPVRYTPAPAPILLLADPARLARVLDNLLANAAKYSAPTAPIDVATYVDDQAHVAVRDRGVGIPPEELPRLFHRFYRTRDARRGRQGGLGLGLYISHQIVAAHGGQLRVESRVGEGSCFTVDLPLAEAVGPTEPAPARQPLTAPAAD